MKKYLSTEFVVVVVVVITAIVAGIHLFSPVDPKRENNNVSLAELAERAKSEFGIEYSVLKNSLTLTPVITDEDPFIRTYLISFNINASTEQYLPKDPEARRRMLFLRDNGKDADGYDITPKTNGTYQVKWNTMFASFGQHTLQLEFYFGYRQPPYKVFGPTRTECVTNLVRFDIEIGGIYKFYNNKSTNMGRVYGLLQMPNADYRIDIFDTNRILLKTISGHTQTRVIDEMWDMKADDGQVRKGEEFDAKVYIWPTLSNINNTLETNNTPFGPYPFFFVR